MFVVILVTIEQIIKQFVYINMPQKVLIPGWLGITYTENRGTVFGLMQGSNIFWIVMTFIILGAILYIIFENEKKHKYTVRQKMWKLILAGGFSNLIDRVFRGFVIDYVSLKFFGVCNIADFCIVIGVLILVIEEIKELMGVEEKRR